MAAKNCQRCGIRNAVKGQKYCTKCRPIVLRELAEKGAFTQTTFDEYVERESYRPKRPRREEEDITEE